jgi:hypothetical protein
MEDLTEKSHGTGLTSRATTSDSTQETTHAQANERRTADAIESVAPVASLCNDDRENWDEGWADGRIQNTIEGRAAAGPRDPSQGFPKALKDWPAVGGTQGPCLAKSKEAARPQRRGEAVECTSLSKIFGHGHCWSGEYENSCLEPVGGQEKEAGKREDPLDTRVIVKVDFQNQVYILAAGKAWEILQVLSHELKIPEGERDVFLVSSEVYPIDPWDVLEAVEVALWIPEEYRGLCVVPLQGSRIRPEGSPRANSDNRR